MEIAGFDWDRGNQSKCQKHGVSLAEIETVFTHAPHVAPDPAHSREEDRFIAVGRNAEGRFLSPLRSARRAASVLSGQSAPAICTKRKMTRMKKKIPRITTDKQAEAFLGQDLSGLDFSQFTPAHFEFEPKSDRVNMRLPNALLKAVKASALKEGMPYQRFIRLALERAVNKGKKKPQRQ